VLKRILGTTREKVGEMGRARSRRTYKNFGRKTYAYMGG
jgi:hypothetical protein